jgi:hypothetical protein
MTKPMDTRQVAATNPGVEVKKVEEALAYRDLMMKAGVFRKADYRISPSLGPAVPRTARSGSSIAPLSKKP